jgi:hypothetical protein
MSPPGRPKGEYRRAQPEGTPVSGMHPMGLRIAAVLAALLVAAAAALGARYAWHRDDGSLAQRIAQIAEPAPDAAVLDCAALARQRPLVLLVLGQSNAGNHALPWRSAPPVAMVAGDGRCLRAAAPLPGATGRGGSFWSSLPAALQEAGLRRPVVLGLLAVDGTTIDDWVRDDGPLRAPLSRQLDAMRRAGLAPEWVLWQHGEADAQHGIDRAAYRAALDRLAALVQTGERPTPILLARSTVCRSEPHLGVRDAVHDAIEHDARRFRPGPDTDLLVGELMRYDGCHFTAIGSAQAAALWAEALAKQADRLP